MAIAVRISASVLGSSNRVATDQYGKRKADDQDRWRQTFTEHHQEEREIDEGQPRFFLHDAKHRRHERNDGSDQLRAGAG